MTKEILRMQMLSGVITEGEYIAKLEELNSTEEKDSLNEHYVAGGIVGIGAINQIPSRAKADYEDAFEHFLGQKYALNEEEDVEEGKEVEEPSLYEAENPLEGLSDQEKAEHIAYMTGRDVSDILADLARQKNIKK